MTDSWRTWLPDTEPEIASGEGDIAVAEREVFIDDDPLLDIKLGVRQRAHVAAGRRRLARAAGAGAAVLGVVAIGAGALMMAQRPDSHAAAPAPAPVVATSTVAPWCAENRSGTVVVGNGKGRPAGPGVSGPDLILYQQWQWYVARNADTSRAVLAADAQAADPDQARAAVAAIPAGTRHCVTITTLAPGRYDVQIDEKHADGTSAHWQQSVDTAVQQGRTVITSITAGGER
ncbi:hypothetical protein AB0L82_35255 [Nocardia sp. NPDC052001]|uniref:hypothetical protein n=1 Tax=Nocardia sp. NPDC052001 TaxID=3154853 RepID=UPI0034437956